MNQEDIPPQAYKRVIFKSNNDKEAESFLNTYNYENQKINHFKFWDEDIHKEERYIKKKIREDQYIADIDNVMKPVLLISKKHKY